MAWLDKRLKQRMIGALVLLALAVIFLPMLFTREDEVRQVVVEAPPMPKAPPAPRVEVEPVAVLEPVILPEEPPPSTAVASTPATPAVPAASTSTRDKTQATNPAPPPAQAKVAEASRLDANSLPASWSIQLASLSNSANAQALQKTLRSQGYNAYIRHVDGMNRVYVGPVIERSEANRLRDQLKRQHSLSGFVVRFQPERS
ncbi:SPOR domain-containing protein [Azotobacter chroococcum]|uniref:Sporulation domain-containing protein n=1 Tax=Azotobacter chroococcum NCIMB 8003 TaxID=1328314 RepID=A0A0C4WKW9_9GAMM|nr:SPOR domain-containing protein [Azotobacter chroococcum]AJE20889.1 Sporulation domain-containing protein [Azotobacter chroococcum NCIMB 8003]